MVLFAHGCQTTKEHHSIFFSDGWGSPGQVDFCRSFWWPSSAWSPFAVWCLRMECALVFIGSCAQCCLITVGGPVDSWQQLPNSVGGKFWTPHFPFRELPEFLWSSYYLTVSNQLWNYWILLKWNDFPEKGHIIPHVNTLPLLHFTAFCCILLWLLEYLIFERLNWNVTFPETNWDSKILTKKIKIAWVNQSTTHWSAFALTLEITQWAEESSPEYPLLSLKDVITSSPME